MYTGNPEAPDDVFGDVLKMITDFVRQRVVPREREIMSTDAIPDDLRRQAAEMGLGYAIPQEWGGMGVELYSLGLIDAEVVELAVLGHWAHVYMDRVSRSPVPIPAAIRDVLALAEQARS